MSARTLAAFSTIRTEGAMLPSDILVRVASGDKTLGGLEESSYHLATGEKIGEATNRAWNRLQAAWANFQSAREKLAATDTGTSLTRERWLLPLFQLLDYGRLQAAKAEEIGGKSYAISHAWQQTPIHLVGCNVDLDRRTQTAAGGMRSSPHSLLQELLNRNDQHLWGIVSNGLRLRLLRDNISLTRQAYVEFDLEAMMAGEAYPDFVLLWLLLHQSRFEAERPDQCQLEKWSQAARTEGVRVLDGLRDGVQRSIEHIGQGFLAHPSNTALRERLRSGALDKQDYYRQILRLVYRLLFLFVADDRDLLLVPTADPAAQKRYREFYATTRLRRLATTRAGSRHHDLYCGLKLVMEKLSGDGCTELALPALGSFLFSPRALPDLNACDISNLQLLEAIRALAVTQTGQSRRVVDYKNLGAEELGSVYESLLELHPDLNAEAASFELKVAAGSERKKTGSYYTPTSLISCLLDSALDPVLLEAAKQPEPEAAILKLKVVDPACGSGHFLIAAAHRIAKRLAAARTGEEEPPPEAQRKAIRDVIGHCIYGVDVNPMAVELCKVSLWMEALEPGKPLSFLEHRIQPGNSLLGATPRLLATGVPDEAFQPIEGDTKEACAKWRKVNKSERKAAEIGAAKFAFEDFPWLKLGNFAQSLLTLDRLADDTIEKVRAKTSLYENAVRSSEYMDGKLLADAWCAAFVWPKNSLYDYPITEELFRRIERNPHGCEPAMRQEIERISSEYNFLHWQLAFPDVFRIPPPGAEADNENTGWSGGFDVVLGNPPWERLRMDEKEHFAASIPEISVASTTARDKIIKALRQDNPDLYLRWMSYRRTTEGTSSLIRHSGRYPLTGRSKFNTAGLFVEHFLSILSLSGRAGVLVPTGVATDESAKDLFCVLTRKSLLTQLYDFENREGLFPAVDSRYRFCILVFARHKSSSATFSCAFLAQSIEDLRDPGRTFQMSNADISLINPNSGTCPVVRDESELAILRKCYRLHGVLILDEPPRNVWDAVPTFMFQMSDDDGIFARLDTAVLTTRNGELTAVVRDGIEPYVRLYEAKLIHQFDHRFATFDKQSVQDCDAGNARDMGLAERGPDSLVVSRFFLPQKVFLDKMMSRPKHRKWLIGYREIARATDARTLVVAFLPYVACGRKVPQLYFQADARLATCVVAVLNSFVVDWIARCKLSSTSISNTFLAQMPIPDPELFQRRFTDDTVVHWISQRVLELTFTAWDLVPFANDCGYAGEPFRWSEERRRLLRAELDAFCFRLYQISRDEAAYILDTFPIVRRKDEAAYGEYRTKRVILEIYDSMAKAERTGDPYQTRLDPPPADPRVAHAQVP
jgi:hypothetical protein